MKKAFSLIELLIGLIIMSLLFSAFIPLVTKKLKASDITVGSFNNNEGQVITCKDGYHELNNKCALDIENCLSYDNLNKCIVCKAGYLLQDSVCYKMIDNCKTQSANTCNTCNTGYILQNNACYLSISNCKTQSGATCSACNSGYTLSNNACYVTIANCKTQSGNTCSACNTGYTLTSNGTCTLACNCTNGTCASGTTYCASCNSGYTLYNNTCVQGTQTNCYDFFCNICTTTSNGTCTVCKDGYTLYNGKCYFGNLEGCNNPSYDDNYQRINCASCATGYTKCNSGSCRLTTALNATCPANSNKIGCTCVAKYNIGDGKYGENLSTVKTCIAGSSCSVTNAKSTSVTARNLEAACWKGTTASTCNANYGGYSGCTRTVCNWRGGYEMCNSIGWRLPTMQELAIYASTTYSSTALASNGLMFCDSINPSSVAPLCVHTTNCIGGYDNYCYSRDIWSSTFNISSKAFYRIMQSTWNSDVGYLGYTFSIRCVKDL